MTLIVRNSESVRGPTQLRYFGDQRQGAVFVIAAICIIMIGCRGTEPEGISQSVQATEHRNEDARETPGEEKISRTIQVLERDLAKLLDEATRLSRETNETKMVADQVQQLNTQAQAALDTVSAGGLDSVEIQKHLADLQHAKERLTIAIEPLKARLDGDSDVQAVMSGLRRANSRAFAAQQIAYSWYPKNGGRREMTRFVEIQLASAQALEELDPVASVQTQAQSIAERSSGLDSTLESRIKEMTTQVAGLPSPASSPSPALSPAATSSPIALPTASVAPTAAATPINLQNQLDTILKALPWGNIAYEVKNKVPLHSESKATLVIWPTKTQQELESEARAKMAQNHDLDARVAHVQISPRMRATLTATDAAALTITPVSVDGIQGVSFETETTWFWTVRANKGGKHSVMFTLEALLLIDGTSTPKSVKTYTDAIEVSVTTGDRIWDFLEKYWQWVVATIVIPLGGFLLGYMRKRRNDRDVDLDSP
jgi:hypothetical protein